MEIRSKATYRKLDQNFLISKDIPNPAAIIQEYNEEHFQEVRRLQLKRFNEQEEIAKKRRLMLLEKINEEKGEADPAITERALIESLFEHIKNNKIFKKEILQTIFREYAETNWQEIILEFYLYPISSYNIEIDRKKIPVLNTKKIDYIAAYPHLHGQTIISESYGCRPTQEDRTVVGSFKIESTYSNEEIWKSVLKNTVKSLHEQVKENLEQAPYHGSCLLATVMIKDKIYTANLGDSEAFIVEIDETNNEVTVKRINTRLHNPSEESEKIRVKEAGGLIEGNRLGGMGVSGAIGDTDVQFMQREPDIYVSNIPKKGFLISACDGLREGFRGKGELEKEIKRIVNENRDNPEEISRLLLKSAYDNDSGDNITVSVTPISNPSLTQEQEKEKDKEKDKDKGKGKGKDKGKEKEKIESEEALEDVSYVVVADGHGSHKVSALIASEFDRTLKTEYLKRVSPNLFKNDSYKTEKSELRKNLQNSIIKFINTSYLAKEKISSIVSEINSISNSFNLICRHNDSLIGLDILKQDKFHELNEKYNQNFNSVKQRYLLILLDWWINRDYYLPNEGWFSLSIFSDGRGQFKKENENKIKQILKENQLLDHKNQVKSDSLVNIKTTYPFSYALQMLKFSINKATFNAEQLIQDKKDLLFSQFDEIALSDKTEKEKLNMLNLKILEIYFAGRNNNASHDVIDLALTSYIQDPMLLPLSQSLAVKSSFDLLKFAYEQEDQKEEHIGHAQDYAKTLIGASTEELRQNIISKESIINHLSPFSNIRSMKEAVDECMKYANLIKINEKNNINISNLFHSVSKLKQNFKQAYRNEKIDIKKKQFSDIMFDLKKLLLNLKIYIDIDNYQNNGLPKSQNLFIKMYKTLNNVTTQRNNKDELLMQINKIMQTVGETDNEKYERLYSALDKTIEDIDQTYFASGSRLRKVLVDLKTEIDKQSSENTNSFTIELKK